MNIRPRFLPIVVLPLVIAVSSCSREEPASEPAPAGSEQAVPPPPAEAVPAPAAPAVPPELDAERIMANPTAEEPGFLTAFADANETIGDAPLAIELNVDVVENTGTPPYSFTWDFGDATEFSTEKSPTHVYKIPGNFRASVIIRDSKGEVDQDYIDVAVSDPNAPVGITAEQLMQQVPLEEILRQAREAAEAGGKQPAAEESSPAE